MSEYRIPDPVYKRRSIRAADFGILFNLTKRIFPMTVFILLLITGCVVFAYSINGRVIPRQFMVGICITFAIIAVLWTSIETIRCCRPKCAGKYDLRLDSPAEPAPVPEAPAPGWDGTGSDYFHDRPKQTPAVARRGRESVAIFDLYDRVKEVFKDWTDERNRSYRDSMRAKLRMHAPRERDLRGIRYAPRVQHDRRRETAQSEGMLAPWRKSYIDLPDSGITYDSAEYLYRRQRDRDYRGARDEQQRAHRSYYENDENQSQVSDNTEVEPPQRVLRQNIHHFHTTPEQMQHLVDAKEVFLKLPDTAHNPRR